MSCLLSCDASSASVAVDVSNAAHNPAAGETLFIVGSAESSTHVLLLVPEAALAGGGGHDVSESP